MCSVLLHFTAGVHDHPCEEERLIAVQSGTLSKWKMFILKLHTVLSALICAGIRFGCVCVFYI